MARIIRTAELPLNFLGFHEEEKLHIYNGLDCCVTHEVHGAIHPHLLSQENYRKTYDFSRAMQAPALDMMMRGLLVDPLEQLSLLHQFQLKERRLREILDRYADAVWGRPLNPNSPQQLKAFFYEAMKLPPEYVVIKGERKISTNREALERLAEHHFYAEPIVKVILAARDMTKRQTVLKSGVDSDGRMRFSFNITATETGRWSSSINVRGGGTNAQNIIPDIRRIFIADEGMKLAYVDLEQAETWITAHESQDENLIAACHSGDIHTFCAKIIWPLQVKDRETAEKLYYRHFTFRDMSKRGGHACNYVAKPQTLMKHLKLSFEVATSFYQLYHGAFPGLSRWHMETSRELFTSRKLVTCFGFERQFFGRPEDETTLREAVAFRPQSTVAQLLNRGLYRLWREAVSLGVWLHLQVHDAILYQFPVEREMEVVPAVEALLREVLTIKKRSFTIPTETKVGYMWYAPKKGEPKVDGQLEVWKPDGRTLEQRRPPFRTTADLLDFRLPGIYQAPEESRNLPQVVGY